MLPFQVLNYLASFPKKMSQARDTPAGHLLESAKSLERSAAKDNLLWHLSSRFGHRQGKCPHKADPLHANEKHLSGGFSHEYRYEYLYVATLEKVQNRCTTASGCSPLVLEWTSKAEYCLQE